MIPDWLTTLAAAGSAALVNAASTDVWQSARDRFARLLGRDDTGRTETAARRLDDLRHIAQEPGNERALAEARRAWRQRLEDLLEEHPDAADELRSAIAELPPPRSASTATNHQVNQAYDHGTVTSVQNGDLTIHHTTDSSRP
ncbi:hypothetical protein [Streptomyces lincolnensis]|uniref:hypothetical protein n=1 Tax=Streptomyces lincolnensis TaxID=1915 RepID=UPI0009A0ECAD|nr:hypothetical protein [Streptomyces lincolnensis]QMV09729.1 hypothetical protein GJU35_31485 [Streptomyces lincolnensis]